MMDKQYSADEARAIHQRAREVLERTKSIANDEPWRSVREERFEKEGVLTTQWIPARMR
jgi:hypothetical protein